MEATPRIERVDDPANTLNLDKSINSWTQAGRRRKVSRVDTVLTVFLLTGAIAVGVAIVVGLWVGVFWVLAYLMESIIDRKAAKGGQSRTE